MASGDWQKMDERVTGEQADCQTEYISERAVNGDIQDIFGRLSNNLISGQKSLAKSKYFKSFFLAVHNSSIGDLVTQSLTH